MGRPLALDVENAYQSVKPGLAAETSLAAPHLAAGVIVPTVLGPKNGVGAMSLVEAIRSYLDAHPKFFIALAAAWLAFYRTVGHL